MSMFVLEFLEFVFTAAAPCFTLSPCTKYSSPIGTFRPTKLVSAIRIHTSVWEIIMLARVTPGYGRTFRPTKLVSAMRASGIHTSVWEIIMLAGVTPGELWHAICA